MASLLRTRPLMFCHRCGWTGWWPVDLRATNGGALASLNVRCPSCGGAARAVNGTRWREIGSAWAAVDAARRAGLAPEAIRLALDGLVSEADADPDEVARRYPFISPIIDAARAVEPKDWFILVLSVLVSLVASQALATLPGDTSRMSDEDVQRMAKQVAVEVEQRRRAGERKDKQAADRISAPQERRDHTAEGRAPQGDQEGTHGR